MADQTNRREENRAFWEERGRSALRGHAATMMAEHDRYLDYVHRAELKFLTDRLSAEPRPRVLDLGCGTGRLTTALAPHASCIIGIEMAESLVVRARAVVEEQRLPNVRIEQGSLEGSLPEGCADVVILSGVLNYLTDETVPHALRQASQALVRGGLLFVRNNCANRTAFYVPAGVNQPPTTHRTAEDYRRAVQTTAGLEIVEDRYLFAPLCMPNLVYYYALPKTLRDGPSARRMLDAWFRLEERTSETRLRLFSSIYPPVLRLLRKPTAFRMIVAVRRA